MSFQETLEKQYPQLLKEISEKSPCGKPVNHSTEFDKIKDLRGAEQLQGRSVDWEDVEKRCVKILGKTSKDLQVMAWLTESWMRLAWMDGLGRGLSLMLYFIENHWDQVYPLIDRDGDESFRISPFIWIDMKLVPQLRLFPLSGDNLDPIHIYEEWIKARYVNPESLKKGEPEVSSEKILENLKILGRSALQGHKSKTKEALGVVKKIIQILAEKNISDLPFSKISKTLKNIIFLYGKVIETLPKEVVSKPVESEEQKDDEVPDMSAAKESIEKMEIISSSFVDRKIKNRAQAYALLEEIADFLKKTEPHSPTPYLIHRAIGWRDMSLGTLLMDLFQSSGGNLQQILAVLGLDDAHQQQAMSTAQNQQQGQG